MNHAQPESIQEPPRETPVVHDTDVLVLGGSCTGVFAAIRAARLGCRVALVEKAGCFGGVATLSLVNIWHSLRDTAQKTQIIAGMTAETVERLHRRSCIFERGAPFYAWTFNAGELQIELDELVKESKITPFLHTQFVAPHVKDGKLVAAIVENKTGRQAIRARMFIDATGDADLCQRLGLETYIAESIQPSTTCAVISGWDSMKGFDLHGAIYAHREEFDIPQGFVWAAPVPPHGDARMLAGTRITGANCADAEALTRSEMEGRRQVRAIMDLVRKYAPDAKLTLLGLPARIGIRETRHVRCAYQLNGDDVLHGRRFDDAIANGSYRVDIHHQDKPGITFRYLDGKEEYLVPGLPAQESRWRPETSENPTFYQVPYRSLIPAGPYENVIVAGRMLDADSIAHAAIRVMVNMNQTGEAAGTAAYLALHHGTSISAINTAELRDTLARGGSAIV
jgi:hypothetical protein